MPIHNSEIAELFSQLADLLEIQDENPFRVRAYRTAASGIEALPRSAADMLADGEDLSKLPGIGKDLAGKIAEIVETGTLPLLEEAKQKVPGELSELMTLPQLGPKRVKALYENLDIDSFDKLSKAAEEHEIRKLSGFGARTEEQILEEIERRTAAPKRMLLITVEQVARPLLEYLGEVKGVKKVTAAGSYRRKRETVGDLDVLVTCRKGSPVMDRFVEYEEVAQVLSKGSTKSTVRLRSGLQVDIRVVPEVSYGAAMHYFTGSSAHNIAVRGLAVKRKLKLNEYGVFRGDKRVAGRKEEGVFAQVDLPPIPPELRENRGEIEAAQEGKLPKLITGKDVRGDLHAHTKATDGRFSLEEMADAARDLGYDYLGITEHSQHLTVAKGFDEKRLGKQIEEIDRLNEKLDGIRVLKGIEVDILEDGSLDLDDAILKELDFTVGSVHSKFNLSEEEQTERILRAMDNPYFTILGHPTGRQINKREPFEVDMERVISAALERGCYLELNAHPERLDLNDIHCKMAKEMGLKVVLSTDAHSVTDLKFMQYGINQARRGWLEKDDVVNTRSWRELKKLLRRE